MPPGFGIIVGVLTRTIVGSRIQVPEVWNYTQSGFFETCVPSSTLPTPSGYFQITQSGKSVTAIDDQGVSYRGVIDGANYSWVRTYPEDGGRTSVVYLVTLGSATRGSGNAEFVWDDDCGDCWGQWNIVVKKNRLQNESLSRVSHCFCWMIDLHSRPKSGIQ